MNTCKEISLKYEVRDNYDAVCYHEKTWQTDIDRKENHGGLSIFQNPEG